MKFPINGILWMAIAGLGAGGAYQFWQAFDARRSQDERREQEQTESRKAFAERFQLGMAKAGSQSVGPRYDDSDAFWGAFKDANWTGKEPPKPVDVIDDKEEDVPVVIPKTPLDDIFQVICCVHEKGSSRVILRYKPSANVTPPPEVAAAMAAGGAAAARGDVVRTSPTRTANNRSNRGGNRGGNRGNTRPIRGGGSTGMPSFATEGYVHHMQVGENERLWEPHSHIRLARVADDASHAYFVREEEGKPKEEWEEERIFPEVLDLPQDVLAKLNEMLGKEPAGGGEKPDGPAANVQPSGWQPMDDTQEIGRNRFNIGRNDRAVFQQDPNQLFNDIGTSSWRSRRGNRSGVRITKVKKGYERFGVQVGDVIVSVNGERVRSKQEAYKVGKRLYKRGVRRFEVLFLSAGREVTRTYVAPDEN